MTEFNTWYVRGPAKHLLEEGETRCQVYRAAEPKGPPDTRRLQDGQLVSLDGVYRGHRASHWHEPGHPEAFSVPAGPGCHHTLRRVQEHGQMLPKA